LIYYFPLCLLLFYKSFTSHKLDKHIINAILYGYIFWLGAFKHNVGADYVNYKHMYELIISGKGVTDPIFMAINLLANELGWGYRGVHIIASLICSLGTFIFVHKKKITVELETFLLLFFVVIMSFGYLRQGISVVFLMGIEVSRNRTTKMLFGALALGSHFSSIIYIIIRLFIRIDYQNNQINTRKYFLLIISLLIIILTITSHYYRNGLYSNLNSNGVFFRIFVDFLPIMLIAFISLLRLRLKLVALVPLIIFAGALITPTLYDRVLISLTPLIVIYNMQHVSYSSFREPIHYKYLMQFSYFAFFFMWLLFAPYGRVFWLNYSWSYN
jgi:hypothetical protein